MDLTKRAAEALRFDPFAAAEEYTGQSYKEDDETLGLGVVLSWTSNRRANSLLSELGDTHGDMTWADFLAVIIGYGFELVVQCRFEYRTHEQDEVEYPEQIIAAHRQKKLLLHATSYLFRDGGETVNGGKVYGYLELPEGDDWWRSLEGCSHHPEGELRAFSKDIRKGLIMTLDRIESVCSFVDWHDPDPFLWLVNYAQEKVSGYNYKQIRDEYLEAMPDWVRAFIL